MHADDPRHGTYAGVNQHIRDDETPCDPCIDARRRYQRRRPKMRARGIPGTVPIGPRAYTKLHTARQTGMHLRTIGEQVGASSSTVLRWLNGGPTQHVTPTTRIKLQEWEPQTGITMTGLVRRCRALVFRGYTPPMIAAAANVHKDTVSDLINNRLEFVNPRTRKGIADAYKRLHMRNPAGSERVLARMRNRARAAGWAPPFAWDAIDDPAERPKGMPGSRGGTSYTIDQSAILRRMGGDRTVRLNYAERCELHAQWSKTGRSTNEMSRITGIQKAERYAA